MKTTTLASTFVLAFFACVAGVFAQPSSGWRAEAARADAIYVQAMENAAQERRADDGRAGETWRKAMEAEVAEALRAGRHDFSARLEVQVGRLGGGGAGSARAA